MASIIRTISLSPEEHAFITDYKLSPSELIKQMLWQMKGQIKVFANERIESLSRELQNQCNLREQLEEEVIKLKGELAAAKTAAQPQIQ